MGHETFITDGSVFQRQTNHRRFRKPGADWTQIWECGKAWGSHSCNDHVGESCEYNEAEWGVGGDCSGDWYVYNNTMTTRRRFKDPRGTGNFIPRNCRAFVNNVIVEVGDAGYRSPAVAGGNIVWRTDGESISLSEPAAMNIDPGLDLEAIESGAVPEENEWDIYRPKTSAVGPAGVDFGADWPGSKGLKYRGAVDPNGATSQ